MRKFLLMIVLSIALVGCSSNNAGSDYDIGTMTSADLLEQYEESALADDSKLYIDVRETDEFDESHIAGFTNYPMDDLKEDGSVLPKDKEIVILCNTQNRSFQVAESLVEQGFDEAKLTVVEGGISNYKGETTGK